MCWILVLLVCLSRPWSASQSGVPDPEASKTETPDVRTSTGLTNHGTAPIPSGPTTMTTRASLTTKVSLTTRLSLTTKVLLFSSKMLSTDRAPTVPVKASTGSTENETQKQRLGAYYRTQYMGNATKTYSNTTAATYTSTIKPPDDNLTKFYHNQSHINMQNVSMATASYQESEEEEEVGRIPWRQGHTHHNTKHAHKGDRGRGVTERTGPYFRPPSAISHKYKANSKQFRVDPNMPLDDIDPDCWPHCKNATRGNKRKRKHSSYKKRKYYNYKLLYDTLKGDLRRQETEFYAWIFGATMLTLGSLTTLTSCFVFCFCSEKWKKRRQQRRRRFDKSGEYQRVDSVSSMVDSHQDPLDHHDQMDSVTII